VQLNNGVRFLFLAYRNGFVIMDSRGGRWPVRASGDYRHMDFRWAQLRLLATKTNPGYPARPPLPPMGPQLRGMDHDGQGNHALEQQEQLLESLFK
jgi:hypothetical protein